MNSNTSSLFSRLSYWAKKRPIAARWLIAFFRIVMGYSIFYWGVILADLDMHISNAAFITSAFLYLIGFIFYPRKKTTAFEKINFARQKLCDGLLVFSSCAFWLAAGNYMVIWQPTTQSNTAQIETLQSAIGKDGKALASPNWENAKILKKAKKKRDGISKKIKNWRVSFFKKIKARVMVKLAIIKSAYRKLEGGQIALLILASIAIAGVLGYSTILLSCSLSCNGQEGAATFVGFMGCAITAGAIAWMWTYAVKKNREKFGEPEIDIEPLPEDILKTGDMLTEPKQLEIWSPNVKICLKTGGPKGMESVTVNYNGKVVMGDVPLDNVPICIDLAVQPDMKNNIEITGANGPVNLSVEDGKVIKKITLPTYGGKTEGVDLIFKNK